MFLSQNCPPDASNIPNYKYYEQNNLTKSSAATNYNNMRSLVTQFNYELKHQQVNVDYIAFALPLTLVHSLGS